MTMLNSNIKPRVDLTDYAFSVMQSLDKAMALARAISPIVPTGATTGGYNLFETTAAFTKYAAQRPVGGQATSIKFLSDRANFNCSPYGLKIGIDQYERQQAGDGVILMEQAKTRTLQINTVVAHLNDVIAKAVAGVAADATLGNWSSANVDPIAEINKAIKAVWLKCGVVPNRVVLDFSAWMLLVSNPLVLKRMPGSDLAVINPDRISPLLLVPGVQVVVAETAINAGGGFGNSAATRKGILDSGVLVFASSDVATQYDPSYMKTFSPVADLFKAVYQFEELPHVTWLESDWTCDTQVVSSIMATRFSVS